MYILSFVRVRLMNDLGFGQLSNPKQSQVSNDAWRKSLRTLIFALMDIM